MTVKILSNEKNVLELELEGMDQSLAQLMAEKLNSDSDVEFASYKVEHPLIGSPKLYVRVKKGDAAKMLLEKVDDIKKDVAEFRKGFLSIAK